MAIIKGVLRPEGSNDYADEVHLKTSASQVVEETNKRFMTDAERTKLANANVTSVAGKTGAVTLTKTDVGLANVQNYGIATQAEAEAGTSNVKYMTPLRVKEAIQKQAPIFAVGSFTDIGTSLIPNADTIIETINLGFVPKMVRVWAPEGLNSSHPTSIINIDCSTGLSFIMRPNNTSALVNTTPAFVIKALTVSQATTTATCHIEISGNSIIFKVKQPPVDADKTNINKAVMWEAIC